MKPILGELQLTIESLHAVETGLDVLDYIVDDEVRREIPGAREGIPEQLFVRECEEGIDVALYVAPAVVEQLERDPPRERLHAGNIEAYCIALEGVSHFVMFAWRAQMSRPVSALELEIQAEVDKFVTAWLLLSDQGAPRHVTASVLARRLFVNYELREEVAPEEVGRYQMATRVAATYCDRLARRYGRDARPDRIRDDVRRFYRRGLAEKLRAA